MTDTDTTLRISKLDAARRQLRTAITLWFTDGDPVAVHALAFAAYEIFHYVSKHRDPYRRDLIFDTDHIKEEYLGDWNKLIRKNANFFKHADRDPNDIAELDTSMNEWFISYAIAGRQLCGESQSQEESDFQWWFHVNRSEYLTDKGRKMIANLIPINQIEFSRKLSKNQFYELLRQGRIARQGGRPDYRRVFPLGMN
jgi:hypothetical protein